MFTTRQDSPFASQGRPLLFLFSHTWQTSGRSSDRPSFSIAIMKGSATALSSLLIGPAGWHYADWKGIVYPRRSSKARPELAILADYLDLVEVNSSFYRIPDPGFVRNWLEQSAHNSRFQFIIKLWQGFTHAGEPVLGGEMSAFKLLLAPLHEHDKLATVLVQFPWSFKKSEQNMALLEQITNALRPYPCHVEFRHNSWQDPDLVALLRREKVGWVNIDQPVIGASIGPANVVTTPLAYYRLHGRNYQNWFREDADRNQRYDYLYSTAELEEWLPRVKETLPKTDKTVVVFNNHFKGQAVVNCFQLLALLSDSRPAVPRELAEYYPVLAEFASLPPMQGTLPLF